MKEGKRLQEFAEQIMLKFYPKVEVPKIRFHFETRLGRNVFQPVKGLAEWNNRTIDIFPSAHDGTIEDMKETVIHELAHIVDFTKRPIQEILADGSGGHDQKWVEIYVELGGTNESYIKQKRFEVSFFDKIKNIFKG